MNNQRRDHLQRLAKLVFSVIFFLWTSAIDMIRRLMGRTAPATCVVLHYHEVSPQHRKRFARQLDLLIKLAIPLSADNNQLLRAGNRYVALTFDDGFLSTVENAVPELVQRKIPATLFVTAGLLGSAPQWTTFGGDSLAGERIVPAELLKQVPNGFIAIGSHTLSHPWLPSVPEMAARAELSGSRDKLKNLLNRDIKLFSFPYGAYTDRLVELCREAGYERVFTILPKLAFTDPQEYVTGRVQTDPTDWSLEFRFKLLGAYRWLPSVITWKQRAFRKPRSDRS